jgi:hypothetical protein
MCINDMTMKIMSEGFSIASQQHNFISHVPMTVWRDDRQICTLAHFVSLSRRPDPIRLHPITIRWAMTF